MSKSGFGKFVAGVAVGAGAALLFAPQDGKTTRKMLKAKIDELYRSVKELDKDEVMQIINKKIAEIQKGISELNKEKVLELAKQSGKKILQKCDELVKLAIEKGTPVVEKAAHDVREKAIDVLGVTIEKLENANKKVSKKKRTNKTV